MYVALIPARYDHMQLFPGVLLADTEIGKSRYLSRRLGMADKHYTRYAGCVMLRSINVQKVK
jgi:hypothetical protein